ncbi:O-antigen ligase family protein [Calothrix sp. UHCC 0171]|uniref:O-antigen ligase family protein n=1 Tax=Calothrix sp. UHCC 0171 TaxID=3110245 RepID=UPI002B2026B1|nr:O-antigen ligase family protein [Calothrix sp. UHCC 0171]MEA5571472.1 O-antigen ligase family protein [Calothrix sp. UHCC 0171]
MINNKIFSFHRHPESKLQLPWNALQVGIFIFPIIPIFGGISIGFALLVTWALKYKTIIRRPQNWGFGIFSLILIITTALAQEKTPAIEGIFNFLPFILLFCAVDTVMQTPAQLRHLAWILVIPSIPVVILGFGQIFLSWTTPPIWQNISGWALLPGGNPVGRMASLFMYANILAGYLTITFILAGGLWLEELKKHGNILLHLPTSASPHLCFLTLAVILNFAGLILTNSRNAWAIAIFACMAYAMYQGWRILVTVVAGIVATILLAAFAPTPIAQILRKVIPSFFWARLNDQMYPNRPVVLMRATQWDFAWNMAQQRPLTGWGLRNFTPLYQEKMHIWLGHPHNLFLMLSAEAGIPATLLFISLIAGILMAGFQLLQRSQCLHQEDKLILFSYLLVIIAWVLFNIADVSIFDFRLNALSWLLLGTVSGVVYRYNRVPPKFI